MTTKMKLPSNLLTASSLNVKSLLSPSNKKVQGFDKTSKSTLFSSNIQKLKNKPRSEAIENQYINGLQDEIKYLQLQLKLLQDKELQKNSKIDQLEQFFGDGVPINENILAIKNGFKNYQNSFETKIKELGIQKKERSELIQGLADKVQEMAKNLTKSSKQYRQVKTKDNNNVHEQTRREVQLKRQIENEQEQLKLINIQNRKLAEKMEKITQNKIIDNICTLRSDNHKHTRLEKLKQANRQAEEEYKELQKVCEELSTSESQKSYLIKIAEDNLALKKKSIATERDCDALKLRTKERKMDLQGLLKERLTEIEIRIDMQNKVNKLKDEISKENALTAQDVEKYGRDKEIAMLQKIIEDNKKLGIYTEYYSNLLAQSETNLEQLVRRKPEIKAQIAAFTADLTKIRKSLAEEKLREAQLEGEAYQSQSRAAQYKKAICQLQDKTKKQNSQIELYKQEADRLQQDLKIKQKQLQLIFIVKGLNFEQTEMSKTSSRNIQAELMNFLRNWEKIQRVN